MQYANTHICQIAFGQMLDKIIFHHISSVFSANISSSTIYIIQIEALLYDSRDYA